MTLRDDIANLPTGWASRPTKVQTVPYALGARILVEAGFRGWAVVTMNAVAEPESGRNALAIAPALRRIPAPDGKGEILDPTYTNFGKVDMGWLQINVDSLMGFPEYKNRNPLDVIRELFDPLGCAKAAFTIFKAAGGERDATKGYAHWNAWKAHTQSPTPKQLQDWRGWYSQAAAAAKQIGQI